MATRKTGLGRGLGNLISGGISKPAAKKTAAKKSTASTAKKQPKAEAPAAPPPADTGLFELPIGKLVPNPHQPRRDFDEEHLRELAESIASEGLLQPVVARKVGEQYELIAGERRWRACQSLKMKVIPVRVIKASDASSASLSLIENLQREGLNPIEEALGYTSLMRDFDLTQEQVAHRVGKGRATIANCMRLLALGKEVQGFLRKGLLSTGHAKVILGLGDGAQQTVLARRIVESGCSVREAERLAKQVKDDRGETAARAGSSKRPPAEEAAINEIVSKLSHRFKTRASVKHGHKKGKIVIEYFGNSDLARILEEMGIEN